jgi:hypothetical protein
MTAGTPLASKLGFDPPIVAENYFQERTRRMRFPFFNYKYIDRHYLDQENFAPSAGRACARFP